MTYFSVSPIDLFPSLFLYFSPPELLNTLSEVEKLPVFRSLFNASVFWKEIWRRDFSSFLETPSNDIIYSQIKEVFKKDQYDIYLSFVDELNDDITGRRIILDYFAKQGYDVLLYKVKCDKYDNNFIMNIAAQYGHLPIVYKMWEKGVTTYEYSAICAAIGGHLHILELLLSKTIGTVELYNRILRAAARSGHLNVVNYVLNRGANDYNDAMFNASWGGHINLIDIMLSVGATDYNSSMAGAAASGHIDIVDKMLQLGANNYQSAINEATFINRSDIVSLIQSYCEIHT